MAGPVDRLPAGFGCPGPLGDKLMLRILRETRGGAVAVPDERMANMAALGARRKEIDFSPEGGAAMAAAVELQRRGDVRPD